MTTVQGEFVDCNPAFEKLLGMSKDELLTADASSTYDDPKERQRFLEVIREDGYVHGWKMTYVNGKGNKIYCVENAFLDKSKGSNLIIGSVQDITQEEEEKEKFEALFNSSPQGMLLVAKNEVVNVNASAEEMFGYSLDEWRNIDFWNPDNEIYQCEDSEKELFSLKLKNALLGSTQKTNLVCKRKNNSYFHAQIQIIPLAFKSKEIYLIDIHDVSERVIFESSILESEDRFKTLSSVAMESIVFIHDDVVVDCNDQFANQFGYSSRNDLVDRNISELINKEELARLKHHLKIDHQIKTEMRAVSRKGKVLFLEATGTEIQHKGKNTQVLLFYDITPRKRMEQALEQSIDRFKTLVENAPNGIIILIDGKIKYINSSGLELMGCNEEDEVYDTLFEDYFESKIKESVAQDIKDVREGIEIDYKEEKLINKKGETIDIGLKYTLTVYDNKPSIQVSLNNLSTRVQLVQETLRAQIAEELNIELKKEIEDRISAEEKLLAARNFTRNIIESSIDMIIAVDQNGNVTEFNSAAQSQFGYELDDVIGQPISVLYKDQVQYKKVLAEIEKNQYFSGEIENVKKSGEKFSALLSASLIKNNNGQIIGSMGVSRDITEARKNERQILEQKAKLESIFNSTQNMMMWTLDKDFKVTSFNKNFEKSMKSEFGVEISHGFNYVDETEKLIDTNSYQNQLDLFEKVLKGKAQQFELPLKTKHDETIWQQFFLNPVFVDGELEEMSVLTYDITDRKEIDRKILNSLKEKEVLLQEVHHRVKNNLQVISSILNLQSSFVSDERTLEILSESQSRIKTMSFIHETLYQSSDFSSIEFTDYIKTLGLNLIQSYALQSTEVNLETDFDQIYLNLDQAIPCGLIVNELVSNAMKYAFVGKPKGTITIRIKESENTIELEVKDNGVGLPESYNPEESDSLGIYLVYALVEQLDASLSIDNKHGTSFLITFGKQ